MQKTVRKERYCGMCDRWYPSRVGTECPACGFDLSKPVPNLMDALENALNSVKSSPASDQQKEK